MCSGSKNQGAKLLDVNISTGFSRWRCSQLLAGDQVVVVLKRKLTESSYVFDSDISGGTDFVFVCNTFPYSVLDESSIFDCRDSMTGKEYKSHSLKSIKSML